jgi:hypothetical protein
VEEKVVLEKEILSFIKTFSDRSASGGVFNALALRIFRYQYANNIYYRRFCELAGHSPARVQSWKDIPAMPTAAFKELVLTSFPVKEKIRIFRTSGTARGARRGAHYFQTLRLYEASVVSAFKIHLLSDHATLSYCFLMNSPKDSPDSSLSHMMGVVDRRFAAGKGRYYVRRNIPRFDDLLRDLKNEKKKVFLLATAFSLKGFLDHMKERNVRLNLAEGSRLMETGGFKGKTKEISKTALYREVLERLGIPKKFCVSEYGMTELSSQYYGRALGPFIGPAWLRAVVVDPRTGKEASHAETGILKHVDLANLGSVIAVQSEDLGKRMDGGFKLFGRAPGSALRGCSLTYERFLRLGDS